MNVSDLILKLEDLEDKSARLDTFLDCANDYSKNHADIKIQHLISESLELNRQIYSILIYLIAGD